MGSSGAVPGLVPGFSLPWPRYADGTPLRFGDAPDELGEEVVGFDVAIGPGLEPRCTVYGPCGECSFDYDEPLPAPAARRGLEGGAS